MNTRRPCLQFIHCADIHLDSPFLGLRHRVPDEIFARIREATFKAFENIIDSALQHNVDFIIIAGDVFDSADRSLRAQLFFRDQIIRAADEGISVFIAHGNHDPLDGWSVEFKLPPSVHRFGPEVSSIPVKINNEKVAWIHGFSYPTREIRENVVRKFPEPVSGAINIGVLHCNVGGHPEHDNYAPCTLQDLIQSHYDYWALGHIHTRSILHESPWVVYPGNSQARHEREPGPRGFYLVKAYNDQPWELNFIEACTVRWEQCSIDASSISQIDKLEHLLVDTLVDIRAKAENRTIILQITLTGRSEIHSLLRRADTLKDLLDYYRDVALSEYDIWISDLILKTTPPVDFDQRRKIEDFIGDYLRVINEMRHHPEPADHIRQVLISQLHNRTLQKWIHSLSEDELMDMINQAESLGFERLEEEC